MYAFRYWGGRGGRGPPLCGSAARGAPSRSADEEKGRTLGHRTPLNRAAAARLEPLEEIFQLAALVIELHPKAGREGLRELVARDAAPWRRGEEQRHIARKGAL